MQHDEKCPEFFSFRVIVHVASLVHSLVSAAPEKGLCELMAFALFKL